MRADVQAKSFPGELRPIAEKVLAGERLDAADALVCFETHHLLHLGRLADHVRRRLHGDVAYFNINRHINPTNVCVYTYNCKFCSFAALPGRGPRLGDESRGGLRARRGKQGGNEVTEFHIVGGSPPRSVDVDWYLEMMRGLKERFPDACT